MAKFTLIARAVCLAGLLASTAAAADSIHWQPNLEAAQSLAKQSNRLVLIHFWAPWCKPCRALEQSVFAQPGVGAALDPNFVMVKINRDDSPATARMYNVTSLPTDVVTTPDGRQVAAILSPQSPQLYVAQMNQAADGHRHLGQSPYSAVAQAPAAPNSPAISGSPIGAPPGQNSLAPAGPPPQAPAGYAPQTAGYAPPGAAAPPAAGAGAGYAANPGTPATTASYGTPATNVPYSGQPAAAGMAANGAPPVAGAPQERPKGLDGYCPVALVENRQWISGDPRWGANHRGHIYLFTSAEAQRRFLANPDRYTPVINGDDPVLALDNRQITPGNRAHGVFYGNRIFLFSSEDSLHRFQLNPNRYAAEAVSAMR